MSSVSPPSPSDSSLSAEDRATPRLQDLPRVACVLLNSRREILLLRDAPQADAWHLPEAPLRVGVSVCRAAEEILASQAGVSARAQRLLDAFVDSDAQGAWRTTICVELEHRPAAAPAATEPDPPQRAFFPLGAAPRLACARHNETLRRCAESHLEEWIMRDSFGRLEDAEGKALLSDELLRFIAEHSHEVAGRWVEEICSNPATPDFAQLSRDTLLERSTRVLSQFDRWLRGREAEAEIAQCYFDLGRERRAQGLRRAELIGALQMLKHQLWRLAQERVPSDRPFNLYRLLELAQRIAAFFDQATFHLIRGYDSTDDESRPAARRR